MGAGFECTGCTADNCTYRRTAAEGWKFVTVKLSVVWMTGSPQQMKAG